MKNAVQPREHLVRDLCHFRDASCRRYRWRRRNYVSRFIVKVVQALIGRLAASVQDPSCTQRVDSSWWSCSGDAVASQAKLIAGASGCQIQRHRCPDRATFSRLDVMPFLRFPVSKHRAMSASIPMRSVRMSSDALCLTSWLVSF